MRMVAARKEKIISDGKIRISMHTMGILFFFAVFFMPDYIGINLGVALNMQRIMLILIWMWILGSDFRRNHMLCILISNKMNLFIICYLFVCLYTMVARLDIGTFFNPLMDEAAVFYTTIYLFEDGFRMEEFLDLLTKIGYALCLIGILEYILKTPIFGRFASIPGIFVGAVTRDGMYRICGPAHHPLGYGLFLLVLFPLTCLNVRSNSLSLLHHFPLTILIALNIYLTGSRSTLGLFLVELIVLFLMTDRKKKVLLAVAGGISAVVLILICLLFFRTEPVQELLGRIATALDGALGTTLAADYFDIHSTHLSDSTIYRTYLPKIFTLDWLNPLVGKGNKYKFSWYVDGYLIESIDNFYVHQFIKIAYPGLVTTILLILANARYAVAGMLHTKDKVYRTFFLSFVIYFVNLYWVDSLGTLDYIFVLFGILYVYWNGALARKNTLMQRTVA